MQVARCNPPVSRTPSADSEPLNVASTTLITQRARGLTQAPSLTYATCDARTRSAIDIHPSRHQP
jgi:hypothetical protein